MVEPDPWNVIDKNQENKSNCVTSTLANDSNTIPFTFEDNFLPTQSNSSGSLPDSIEYIEALERKLSKLKKSSNYLDQLKARREHCIENLLVGNINLDDYNNSDNHHLDEDFETNRRRELLRYIQPEQPINLGELVTIIKHDYLDNQQDRETTNGDNNDNEDGQVTNLHSEKTE